MEIREYKIRTMADLMQLDDDQIDRFCEELPIMVRQMKAVVQLMNACGEAIGADLDVAKVGETMVWIDDGKRDTTITLTERPEAERQDMRCDSCGGVYTPKPGFAQCPDCGA